MSVEKKQVSNMTQGTDQDDDGKKKPLTLSSSRLELTKTVEAGKIKQSFSQGRTKTVTVEVKRKLVLKPSAAPSAQPEDIPPPKPQPTEQPRGQESGRILTEEERAARVKALSSAGAGTDTSVRKSLEEEYLRKQAELEAQKQEEAEAAMRREDEQRRKTESESKKGAADQPEITVPQKRLGLGVPADDEPAERKGVIKPKKTLAVGNKRDELRQQRTGKLTLTEVMREGEDGVERMRSIASFKRAREKEKRMMAQSTESKKMVREVIVPETITVQELANRMAERGADVVKSLMKLGVMATITQSIDADTAELIVQEFGHKIKRVTEGDVEIGLKGGEDQEQDLVPRPPVVTIMGHVDHGKTSLLDALRLTDVVAGEAGGITQHIGAYCVTLASGAKITFIDTPGHEAFSEMRARGANATDIVVLVVAADDGVMKQTAEAISHARAAKAPIIVAVNKIDKPAANTQRVLTELLNHELVTEAMGGDILAVEVSAKEKRNLDKLEEAILLQAEIMNLRANPNRNAEGIVIEAKLERGRGSVATVLVQHGTLKVGQIFIAGQETGRVRALVDDKGHNVVSCGPGIPVEVVGLNGTPVAGDDFVVVESEERAREISEHRRNVSRNKQNVASRNSLEDMFAKIQAGEVKELGVVIKSDVHGSLEAIRNSLEKLSTGEVAVKVLHAGVGGITESDVSLAAASKAIVVGFNVRANPQAREIVKRDNIDLRYYSIIYEVVDDIKAALTGMLSPELREEIIGNAEIRDVFNITKVGKVAGCYVTSGVVKRGAGVRLLRDNTVIHTGTLKTLKRFKDEVKEVKEGFECGMAFESYDDIKPGDVIECYETKSIARTLEGSV